MKSWMQTELEFLCLGDKRRDDRFPKIVETVADHPTGSVPQVQSTWYEVKATYQFWSSPKVDSMQLLQPIGRATAQRGVDYPTVLILHDTTTPVAQAVRLKKKRVIAGWKGYNLAID